MAPVNPKRRDSSDPILAAALGPLPDDMVVAGPGPAGILLLAVISLPLVIAVGALYGWHLGLAAWVIASFAPLVQLGKTRSVGRSA